MSSRIKFSVTVKEVTSNLNRKKLTAVDAGNIGMDRVADEIFRIAQSNVPIDTGALRDSGSVSKQGSNQAVINRIVSYGNTVRNPKSNKATSDYVFYVHEIPNKKHPNSYKFLENALTFLGPEQFMNIIEESYRERGVF